MQPVSGTDSAGLTLQAAGNLGLQSDLEVTATSGMAAATLTSQAPAYGRPDDDSHVGTTGGNVVQDGGKIRTGITCKALKHKTLDAACGIDVSGGSGAFMQFSNCTGF